ncbi:dNA processing protein [Clostridium sp. CAG:354]|nr:DNA-processing protein DprA [Clostridium sp.]MEE0268472.1 DNA-processing protein DprA [Clostridia bacterium]CDE10481.1 dNA processing protein [Clostridium sp. CAG:354]
MIINFTKRKCKEIITINYKENTYPKELLKLKSPPLNLYVEGNFELLNKEIIAIVGSRNCSEYGWKQAKKFSTALSQNGICIISGLAIGIDSISHISAMNNVGRTIAVLGAGFNNIYPKENKELFNKILENNGCVISEYPPEEKVNTKNFQRRNEIISALAFGVLVIEAGYRSGSTITANLAFKQGKKVFSIPSNIDSKLGIGTNSLIQKGAKLVTNVKDILREINMNKCKDIEQEWKYESKNVPIKYKNVYEIIGNMPIDINTICRRAELPIQDVSEQLTMLELNEYIRALPGDMFVKV